MEAEAPPRADEHATSSPPAIAIEAPATHKGRPMDLSGSNHPPSKNYLQPPGYRHRSPSKHTRGAQWTSQGQTTPPAKATTSPPLSPSNLAYPSEGVTKAVEF
jgi:hypothetical protein